MKVRGEMLVEVLVVEHRRVRVRMIVVEPPKKQPGSRKVLWVGQATWMRQGEVMGISAAKTCVKIGKMVPSLQPKTGQGS